MVAASERQSTSPLPGSGSKSVQHLLAADHLGAGLDRRVVRPVGRAGVHDDQLVDQPVPLDQLARMVATIAPTVSCSFSAGSTTLILVSPLTSTSLDGCQSEAS